MEETLRYRQRYQLEKVPEGYSAAVHGSANFGLLALFFIGLLLAIPEWHGWYLVSLPAVWFIGSFVVWLLHRYPLHRPMPFARYAYNIHALQHHRYFTDKNPHVRTARELHIVLFPTWVIAGFCFGVLPVVLVALTWASSLGVALSVGSCCCLFFFAYELVHLCCHLRDGHPVTKIPYIGAMRRHHGLHHKPGHFACNFNIVWPVWDRIFGTIQKV